jgi:AcrR family transcriptional regulator
VATRSGRVNVTTQKAKQRRAEIIDAARQLFMERPYEAVSIGDLERATGLTRGPIYYYFEGKEEIYTTIVVDGLRQIQADIEKMAAAVSSAPDFFMALIREQEGIYRNDKALFDIHFRFFFGRQNVVRFSEQRLAEINRIIADAIGTICDVITKACASGIFRCADPNFAALAIWGMMVTTLQMDDEAERFRLVGQPRDKLVTGLHHQILAMLGYGGV